MGVFWSEVLFHEDCQEFMEWDRYDESWECPVCGYIISNQDAEEEG